MSTSAAPAARERSLLPRPPRLLLALGNPLMGDDGVPWHLLQRLRGDPRLPDDLELAWGGVDLLACAPLLAGRRTVILLDVVLGEPAGELRELDPWAAELAAPPAGAHAPSLGDSLRLLRLADPVLADVDLRLLVVSVEGATAGTAPTRPLAARLEALTAEVLAALGATRGPAQMSQS